MNTILRAARPWALLLLAPALLALRGQAPAPGDARAFEAIQKVVEKNLPAYDHAGISIAIVDGERALWSKHAGLASRETSKPVSSQTLFEMGSVSKVFTCVAVMQLQEQKKLDIDKPFQAYVPEFRVKSRFPAGAEAITIRMLMTHHSGIVTDDDPWETTHPERFFYRALLDHVKGTELLFPPGQRWHYSSFGMNLLGLLVERVSGMDYAAYMNKHVLGPLEMPHASFDVHDLAQETIAEGYNYHPVWDKLPTEEIRPSGSLRTPVEEAAHLLSMVLNQGTFRGRQVLTPASVQEMLRIQGDDNPLDQGCYMGLGFRAWYGNVRGTGSLPIFFHDGVARHRSFFTLIPTWKIGILVSVNDYNATPAFVREIRKLFPREIAAASGLSLEEAAPLPPRLTGTAPLPKGVAGEYATTYGHRTLRVGSDGTLAIAQRRVKPVLVPLAGGDFLLEEEGEAPYRFHFTLSPKGEVSGALVTSDGRAAGSFRKLDPALLPAHWRALAGTYEPRDAEALARTGIPRVELSSDGGLLLVKAHLYAGNADALFPNTRFPLWPLDETRAEVLQGALSGFDGYVFRFAVQGGSPVLQLEDARGAASYRRTE